MASKTPKIIARMALVAVMLLAGCSKDPTDRAIEILSQRKVSSPVLQSILEEEGYSRRKISSVLSGVDFNEIAMERAKVIFVNVAASPVRLEEMLISEGFTQEEAAYGIAHCGVDWADLAGIEAANLLLSQDLKFDELVEELVKKGFSEKDAEYGANLYYGK